jgi:hypothetical protein
MTDETKQEVVNLSVRLLDDAYLAWVAAASDCEHALQAWFRASGRWPEAYFAYRAALDREEAAARDLQRLVELTEPLHDSIAVRAGEVLA